MTSLIVQIAVGLEYQLLCSVIWATRATDAKRKKPQRELEKNIG